VSNKSLTIVLPVHNGESRLRTQVREILELASDLTSKFEVLIVDDGSTDATFEVAEELAARYPQIAVRRERHRGGLGPMIEHAQRHVRTDAVIVHDGVSPIDVNQMRTVWRRWIAQSAGNTTLKAASEALPQEICDFANLPAIHAAMERAHGQLLGFQLIAPLCDDTAPKKDELLTSGAPRTDAAHLSKRAGVGQIPRLPRPKFLSAIAEFALGE
jgi:glycosyltransferase involved in cell wall biosynthesis